jgi:hypothetical protein
MIMVECAKEHHTLPPGRAFLDCHAGLGHVTRAT